MIDLKKIIQYYSMNDVPQEKISMCFRSIFFKFLLGFFCYYPMKIHAMNNSNNREENTKSNVGKIKEEPIQELVGEIELDFDFCSLSNLFLEEDKTRFNNKFDKLKEILKELNQHQGKHQNVELINYCNALVWFFDTKVEVGEKEIPKKEKNDRFFTSQLLTLLECIAKVGCNKKKSILFGNFAEKIKQENIAEDAVGFDTLIMYINDLLEENKELKKTFLFQFLYHLFSKWADSVVATGDEFCSLEDIDDRYYQERERIEKMALCIVKINQDNFYDTVNNVFKIFSQSDNVNLGCFLFFSLYELLVLREVPAENERIVAGFIAKSKENYLNNRNFLNNKSYDRQKFFKLFNDKWKTFQETIGKVEKNQMMEEDISKDQIVLTKVIDEINSKLRQNATLSKQEYKEIALKIHPDKLGEDPNEVGKNLFVFVENFYKKGQDYGEEKDFNLSINYIKKMNPSPQKLILVVNELLSNPDDLKSLQELMERDDYISSDIKDFFKVIEFVEDQSAELKIQINTKNVKSLETYIIISEEQEAEMAEETQKNIVMVANQKTDSKEEERFGNEYIEMLRIWNNLQEKVNYIRSEKLLNLERRLYKYQQDIVQLEVWGENYQKYKNEEYIQKKMNLAQELGLIISEKSLGTKVANVGYSLWNFCGRVYQNWTDSVELFKTKYKADLYKKLYNEEYEFEEKKEEQWEDYNQTTEISVVESFEEFEEIGGWSGSIDEQIEEFKKNLFSQENELIEAANLIDEEIKKAYLKKKNECKEKNAEIKKALDEEYNEKWLNAQKRLKEQKNKKEEESDKYLQAIQKRDNFDKNILWKNMHQVYERLDLLDKVKKKGVSAIPERIDGLVEHFREYFLEAKNIETFMTKSYFSDEYYHDCFLAEKKEEKEEKEQYVTVCQNIIPHFDKTNKKVLNDVVIFCLSYLEKVSKESIKDRFGVKDLFIDLIVTYEDFLDLDTKEKCEKFINTVSVMTLLGVGAAFGVDEADDRYEKMATKIGMLKSKDLSMKLFRIFKKASIDSQKSLYPTQLISWMRWYNLEGIALGTGELECIKNLYQILKKKCNDDGGVFLVKDRLITNVWETSESLKPVLEYYNSVKGRDSLSVDVRGKLKSILLVFFSDYELFSMIKERQDEYNELKTGLKKNLCNQFLFYVGIVENKKEDVEKVLEMYQKLGEHEENDLIGYLYSYLESYETNEQDGQSGLVLKIIDYLEKNELKDVIKELISKKEKGNILEYMKKKEVELKNMYKSIDESLVPVNERKNIEKEKSLILKNVKKNNQNLQSVYLSEEIKKLINAGESIPRDLYKDFHPDFKSFKIPLTEEKKRLWEIIQNYNQEVKKDNKEIESSNSFLAIEYQSNENQPIREAEIVGETIEERKPGKEIDKEEREMIEGRETNSEKEEIAEEQVEEQKRLQEKKKLEEEVKKIQDNETKEEASQAIQKKFEKEKQLINGIEFVIRKDNFVLLSLIDVCLQSLDKEDKNQFMQNEITRLIPDNKGECIEKVDFSQDGNHLIKEILKLCYDTLINHVDGNKKIEFQKNEGVLQNTDVRDFVINYNLFLEQKKKHTGYYSPTKFAFSIFTGIPGGAALILPYICQKSPQISAFVDSMLSKDFGEKVVQAMGNMRNVLSRMTVMSKPIGKQIASFIYSKRGFKTLGAIGLCVILYSLQKIISEWHLRGEKIKLDNLTLKINQSLEKLTGQCQKIFGSTLTISNIKISESNNEQIFCYKYNEGQENIKKEKLLFFESDETAIPPKEVKHQNYYNLKAYLDKINTFSDLFSKKNSDTTKQQNAVLLAALVNTLYCPVQPSLNVTCTPDTPDSGPKQARELSREERMACKDLFKDKVCDVVIEDWKKDIKEGKIQYSNELENIFDATYFDEKESCYFNSKHAIESLRGFVTGAIQQCLNIYTSYQAEDIFCNESLAVKKFLELRKHNDAADLLANIQGHRFKKKEWQEKKQQERESLKKLVEKIKKNNVSVPVLDRNKELMREE